MQGRKWKLVKWSAALLSLYLDARLRKRRKRRGLDIMLIDAMMRKALGPLHLKSFTSDQLMAYESTTKTTIYWHGTGRFQHGKNGEIVDVLARLLKQRGLRPFKDIFDVKQGEMISTSVARQRMYARIYADMHVYEGARPGTRYGTPRFWAYYFIMAINLHAIKELGLWSRKARRRQEAVWREQGKKLWTVKVTKRIGTSVGRFFDDGSDIPGNYPILIGLKRADYPLLKTAAYVARYESRIGGPVPFSAFTHLEVPASKKSEVRKLLRQQGYGDLPVFVFEQCEQAYASKPFSALVG